MSIFNTLPSHSRRIVLIPLLTLFSLTLAHSASKAAPDSASHGENMTTASYQSDERIHAPYSKRHTSWGNYATPGDEGWTWESQQKAWGLYGFTADDKPLELFAKDKKLEISTR